jgi:hypothetical protein
VHGNNDGALSTVLPDSLVLESAEVEVGLVHDSGKARVGRHAFTAASPRRRSSSPATATRRSTSGRRRPAPLQPGVDHDARWLPQTFGCLELVAGRIVRRDVVDV